MDKRKIIIQVIYNIIDEEINSLPSRKDLLNLIIGVEEEIGNKFNSQIALADESAMPQKYSPYRTVKTLAD